MSIQDELNATPGVSAQRDEATRHFVFNHTMLRVKDIAKSLDFYTRVLGFTLVRRRDFAEAKFSLYFLVLVEDAAQIPADEPARGEWLLSQRGVLELTHNHGSEDDAAVVYHDGNREPRGFGHICVSVPDVEVACARLEQLDVAFQKRLSEGRMKDIAFIKDPDGYWVEILQPTARA
jgi:lactoylglutathione lyase